MEQIRIPRWFRGDPGSLVEIHRFSDASEQAYAAVVYLRVIEGGLPHISLVMAKTRVAPLKRVSLPRLELCTASLLAKLAGHVCSTLSLVTSPVFLWTDSTVALSWIRGHPAKWTTFVANRVAEIQRLNRDAKWRHVPGRINPADCASRGVSPRELLEHPLWREPDFLAEAQLRGRRTQVYRPPRTYRSDDPSSASLPAIRWSRRSSPVSRRSANCYAFQRGSGAGAGGDAAPISATAWRPRLHNQGRWVRRSWMMLSLDGSGWLKRCFFHAEMEDIRARRPVSGRSPLRNLTPEVDPEGILRVGGRIKHALLN